MSEATQFAPVFLGALTEFEHHVQHAVAAKAALGSFGAMMNRPGFTGEFFVQNLCDFSKVIHACIEGCTKGLARPAHPQAAARKA